LKKIVAFGILLGLAVFSAGCLANKLAPYDVSIVEVRQENKCVRQLFGGNDYIPCLFVKIQVKNNHGNSMHFTLRKHAIVTADGTQYGKYAGYFGTGGGLYEPCMNSLDLIGLGFELFPGAKKEINLCFPLVTKEQQPILYIGLEENGNLREFKFDLADYMSSTPPVTPQPQEPQEPEVKVTPKKEEKKENKPDVLYM